MSPVLFDFDGTLMDTWPGIEATLRASFRELSAPVPEDAITRSLVGIPLLKVFEELLGSDPSRAVMAAEKYRELFPTVGMRGARPYDGAVGMLEMLAGKGRGLFLVTARNEAIARTMMKDHGMDRFFSGVRGEQEGEFPDGKAHMIAEVLQRFELDPSGCVMVGDRRYDMEAAGANGVMSIGVTYGYGTREELTEAGASRLAGSIKELTALLGKEIR